MSMFPLLGSESCRLKVPLSGRLFLLLSGLRGRAGVICKGRLGKLKGFREADQFKISMSAAPRRTVHFTLGAHWPD